MICGAGPDEGNKRMNQEIWDIIEKTVNEAEFVLVGIGEEFQAVSQEEREEKKEKILSAYNRLAGLIGKKPYFVVTENRDDLIFQSELMEFFIVSPFGDENRQNSGEEQWNAYLNWLAATLGHRLCILELGVGFGAPQVIRWPFEKTAMFNQKSTLVRVNARFPQLTEETAGRGISIGENALEVFGAGERGGQDSDTKTGEGVDR